LRFDDFNNIEFLLHWLIFNNSKLSLLCRVNNIRFPDQMLKEMDQIQEEGGFTGRSESGHQTIV
jgi:hypothetical protein